MQRNAMPVAPPSVNLIPRRARPHPGCQPSSRALATCNASASPRGLSPSASYFEVLGVPETASLEEVKAAFRAKSKLLHPDVSKEPTAASDFMLLRRAYTTLSTPELRAEYEAQLGLPSARASDPRFARFERWRREVVPDLRIQLDFWSRIVDGIVEAWGASLDERERKLGRLYTACVTCLRQLSTAEPGRQQQQQQPLRPAVADAPGSTAAAAATAAQPAAQPARFGAEVQEAIFGGGAGVGGVGGDDGGVGGGMVAAAELAECLVAMAAELAGIADDAGDGTARVQREVDKRYEQVLSRYPAYPDIVWLDVWEETSEQWLALGRTKSQCCDAAVVRWSAVLEQLRREATAQGVPFGELAQGHVAAAGTGRFNAR